MYSISCVKRSRSAEGRFLSDAGRRFSVSFNSLSQAAAWMADCSSCIRFPNLERDVGPDQARILRLKVSSIMAKADSADIADHPGQPIEHRQVDISQLLDIISHS